MKVIMIQNCSNIWLKLKTTDKTRTGQLQRLLNDKGISEKALGKGQKLAVDEDYGKKTEEVVIYGQKTLTLLPDGIVGPVTCDRLNKLTALPPLKSSDGWTRIYYTRDSQDTGYTCGPSSLKMALSVYGLNVNETWLAQKAGANKYAGTSIQGMILAVEAVNQNYNTNLKTRNEVFKSWETLEEYLKQGYPVILRTASWLTPGGEHYTVLVGIRKSGTSYDLVELGDPSNGGFRSTTTTDLRERIKKVSVASVIVITK